MVRVLGDGVDNASIYDLSEGGQIETRGRMYGPDHKAEDMFDLTPGWYMVAITVAGIAIGGCLLWWNLRRKGP